MKILFYLGHPAHFHLFKNVIIQLKKKSHEVAILIKKKDILEELLNGEGFDYINISPRGRKDNRFSIALDLLNRDLQLFKICNSFKPHLMLGTSAEIAHVGKLKRIPSIVVNEDDWDVVPLFSKLAYPFATYILAPNSCRVGKWAPKNISYQGYHELSYLHPKNFTPDKKRIQNLTISGKRFFILRFAKLGAHHDFGRSGITGRIASELINLLEPHGNVFITSERTLEPEFEKYRIQLNPVDIHHALYFAALYIGDSQTMAAEAAVLGTPSIRFNDFVGEIGYLEELEQSYQLTFGIRTNNEEKLFLKVNELIADPNLKKTWAVRREKMLAEKIDLASFMTWLIEDYPKSVLKVQQDPSYQYNFK